MQRMLAAAWLLTLIAGPCAAQTAWERNADWIEEQIEDCAEGWDAAACRYFSARALSRLFGLNFLFSDPSEVTLYVHK